MLFFNILQIYNSGINFAYYMTPQIQVHIGPLTVWSLIMVGYGFFQASTLGMRSQAHALNTIGKNVANVNTGGYKRTDTQFETVLSKTIGKSVSDIGGVTPKDYQIIDSQGVIQSSDRDLDLAIVGRGFFQVSKSLTDTSASNILYTRDGSFRISVENDITVPGAGFTSVTPVTVDSNGVQINPVTAKDGYLVDKNGYYVLGWSAEPDGTFSNAGTVAPLRIDPFTFTNTFTATSSGTFQANLPSNVDIVTDHATAVLASDQGTVNTNLITYTAEIVDSNGTKQTARINMTKSATNQWDISATTSRASSPQADTILLSGTLEAGDQYSVTVDGTTETYTVLGTEASISDVRTALVSQINANVLISANVTASAGNTNGEITLTANATSTTFTASTAATNGASTAQVDTVTIGGTFEVGDVYRVTVDGNSVDYTVVAGDIDMNGVRTSLINAINTDPTVSGIVTAAAGAGAGEITLTADSAGSPFTVAVSTPTTGVTVDNTATDTTTTANVKTTDDNVASSAANTTTQTSAITTITFSPQGTLLSTSPQSVTLAMGFSDGGTASMALDVSGLTQYASDFLPQLFNHNGLASANMDRVQFDTAGHIVGSFSDGTQRKVYKIPLASFANPNALETKNGMVFAETADSGTASLFAADVSGIASFNPYSVELSNVDLATEFSRMIMVQNAYNSNATVFRTVDEMTMVARDLKA